MDKLRQVLAKIWLGLVGATVLGLLWLSWPYAISAFYLDQGTRLIEGKDNQAAVKALETALSSEPENVLAYRQLAKAYLQLNDPELALSIAQQALHLAPNNPVLQLELGDVYDRLGDSEQAIAHYEAGSVGDRQTELTINYLQLADRLWQGEDLETAATIWENKVHGYDNQANLYTSWRLFEYYLNSSEQYNLYHQQMIHFLGESIVLSANPRLANYQIEAITSIIKNNLWPRETKLKVLAYQVAWHSDSPSTELLLQHLTEVIAEDADLWYYLGELYRHQGRLRLAERAYEKTITLSPDYVLAPLRLGMLDEARYRNGEGQAWLAQAESQYQQYHQLVPDDPLGLKKLADLCDLKACSDNTWQIQLETYLTGRKPEFIVNQELDDSWFFWGYDVDEDRLVRGDTVPLWLYWLGPVDGTPISNEDDFYQIGQRRVQVLEEVQNLVPNGGFEIGQAPFGFPNDLYNAAAETRAFVTDIRNDQTTTVALLRNTREFSQTSFIPNRIPVEQDHFYLQAGWMKSEGGDDRLGWRWLGNFKEEIYDYVAFSPQLDYWAHHAKIIKSVPGATEVELWLNNYWTTGKAYFDNIVFVDVGQVRHLQQP